MKQYRTIERNFFARDYYNYNGNEAPRHTAGPVRLVAKVYTESGKCRKIYTTDRNF